MKQNRQWLTAQLPLSPKDYLVIVTVIYVLASVWNQSAAWTDLMLIQMAWIASMLLPLNFNLEWLVDIRPWYASQTKNSE